MGCNCGKAKKAMQDQVKAAQVQLQPNIQPNPTHIVQKTPRQIRIETRAIRIANRNVRMAARNASILAQQAKKI